MAKWILCWRSGRTTSSYASHDAGYITAYGRIEKHCGACAPLRGANTKADAAGIDPLPGESNDISGSDVSRWYTHVTTHAKVRYRNIYPGIRGLGDGFR